MKLSEEEKSEIRKQLINNRTASFIAIIIFAIIAMYLCKELFGGFQNGASTTIIILISIFAVIFIKNILESIKRIINSNRYIEELENGEYTLFPDKVTRIIHSDSRNRERIYITSSEKPVSYKESIYYRVRKGDEVLCIQIESWIHIYKLIK